uniref:Uncharacterized protein n=1 Tax=Trypanosoma vivax (strain Y486) TaxID=1055687 RepID=G0U7S4_TRYVY|nr:hypothetical protein, unlikely [Trypanosoma vivax Y486]
MSKAVKISRTRAHLLSPQRSLAALFCRGGEITPHCASIIMGPLLSYFFLHSLSLFPSFSFFPLVCPFCFGVTLLLSLGTDSSTVEMEKPIYKITFGVSLALF